MSPVNSLASVSDLRYNYQELFERIKESFVVLTQHNKPKAVLVDVDQWNATITKVKRLEMHVSTLQSALRVERGEERLYSDEELTAAMNERLAHVVA
jgi:prevent-host-death family protein